MVNLVHARALSVAAVFLGLEVPDKVPQPPELYRLGIKDEVRMYIAFSYNGYQLILFQVRELRAQVVEKDMLLLEQTMAIKQLEKSAVETNMNVEHLKKKMAALMREKEQMIDAQSEKEISLRLKNAELQLFKEMMEKGNREDTKELEKIILAKELEIAKLRDELAEFEKELNEAAEDSSKLRNELLSSSNELSEKCTEVRHLLNARQDLRDAINILKTSMELQSQQQSDREKQIEVRGSAHVVYIGIIICAHIFSPQSLSAKYEVKAKEAEAYQQTARQKDQEIAKLNSQLQEQEAVTKKQMSSPVPSLGADRSVMELVVLRNLLSKAEEKRENALRQVKALGKETAQQVQGLVFYSAVVNFHFLNAMFPLQGQVT